MISRALLVAAMLLSCVAAKADTITIGGSESNDIYPFFDEYDGMYQQAYSASAFPGPVTIKEITFFQSNYGFITGNFTLSLSTTIKFLNGLSTVYAANVGSNNTVFASGSVNDVLSFSGTPFTYDPSQGNLLLDVNIVLESFSGGALLAGCSAQTANVYNLGGFAEAPVIVSTPACSEEPGAGTFEEVTDGLLTEFTVTPVSTVTPEPSSFLLLATGAIGAAGLVHRRARA